MLKPCIICYKLNKVDTNRVSNRERDKLKRFFQLLGRHLGASHQNFGEAADDGRTGAGDQGIDLINSGMLACEDCSKVVESFCDLYHQMKSAELMLNSKVWELASRMSSAENVPVIMMDFMKCVRRLEIGNGATADEKMDLIFNFKNDLVKKCNRKLQTTNPRLILTKCHSPGRSLEPIQNLDAEASSVESIALVKFEGEPLQKPVRVLGKRHARKLVEGRWCHEADVVPLDIIPSDNDEENLSETDVEDLDFECGDSNEQNEDDSEEDEIVIKGTDIIEPGPSVDADDCWDDGNEKDLHKDNEDPPYKSFTCPEPDCNKSFSQKQYLSRHQENVHCDQPLGARRHHCDICGNAYTRSYHLRRHMKTVHKLSKSDLKNPVKNVDGNESELHNYKEDLPEISFMCQEPDCNKSFTRKENLSKHRINAHGEQPVGALARKHHCDICGNIFPKAYHLWRHMKNVHKLPESEIPKPVKKVETTTTQSIIDPKTGLYKCSLCPKEFKDKSYFQEHYNIVHLHQTQKCDQCDKVFRHRCAYYKHRLSAHKGVRFECPKCKKTFSQKCTLKSHYRVTSCGTGPTAMHKCTLCDKEFNRKGNLQLHWLQVHMKQRPHLCSQCGKAFALLCHLKRHTDAVHSNVRHVCEHCGKDFSQEGKLKAHHLKKHKDDNIDMQPDPAELAALLDQNVLALTESVPEPEQR